MTRGEKDERESYYWPVTQPDFPKSNYYAWCEKGIRGALVTDRLNLSANSKIAEAHLTEIFVNVEGKEMILQRV